MKTWGTVVLCLSVAAARLSAAELLLVDSNNDGNPDQWYVAQNGQITEMRVDRNHDGKVDYLVRYNAADGPDYEEYDYNYDGVMDDFLYHLGGVLVREEVDSNFDGRIDLWVYLHKGIYIERYERDADNDGKKDKVVDYGRR